MSAPSRFECKHCDYQWGPVGVQPYVPTSPTHQLFLLCKGCNKPASVVADPKALRFACPSCKGTESAPLDHCPACGSKETDWVPAFLPHVPRKR